MSQDARQLSEKCIHYEDVTDVPQEIKKYFHQRYDIFSKYDEGIWTTDDGWFGVTPEPIADGIAEHLARVSPPGKTILIDAFAGLGGNTIAFAKSGRWERVFAIEKDPVVLACAKHNAEVYGVAKKIWWIEGDCLQIVRKRFMGMAKTAVLFASPPWGGPGYKDDGVFDLGRMEPYNLALLFAEFARITLQVVLYLPRTSDLRQVAALVKGDQQIDVIHYCMRGASKALCVYYGLNQL